MNIDRKMNRDDIPGEEWSDVSISVDFRREVLLTGPYQALRLTKGIVQTSEKIHSLTDATRKHDISGEDFARQEIRGIPIDNQSWIC